MKDKVQNFGPRLRRFRMAKGLSQRTLQQLTDIDQAHISRLESGTVEGTPAQLEVLAKALSVTVSDILGDSVKEPAGGYAKAPFLDPRNMILTNYQSPPGLRDLASDHALVEALRITAEEWHRLAAVPLPQQVGKEGYMQLLVTLRAIVGAAST